LFSDLAHDAREEGCPRLTAKSSKVVFYLRMAEYIFSVDKDETVKDDVKLHGAKGYAKVVENRISK